MSLPTGFPPELALCVAWVILGLAFLAGFAQLSPDATLRDSVQRRTASRLLGLNEWLNSQIDKQWKPATSSDVIPDLETLGMLKRRVDRAYAIQSHLEWRGALGEIGRASAACHIVGATVTAVALLASVSKPMVQRIAEPVFLTLLAASILLLLSVSVMGIRLSRGRDL